jgi:hypothetical protein
MEPELVRQPAAGNRVAGREGGATAAGEIDHCEEDGNLELGVERGVLEEPAGEGAAIGLELILQVEGPAVGIVVGADEEKLVGAVLGEVDGDVGEANGGGIDGEAGETEEGRGDAAEEELEGAVDQLGGAHGVSSHASVDGAGSSSA